MWIVNTHSCPILCDDLSIPLIQTSYCRFPLSASFVRREICCYFSKWEAKGEAMTTLRYMIAFGVHAVYIFGERECIRKYTKGPFNGYHCANEYFANHTNIKQHDCIRRCIINPQCWVLSYNVSQQFCQLGDVPCAEANPHADTFLMVFGSVHPDHETDVPITWVHYGDNVANIPSRRVDSARYYNPPCTVARYQDSDGNLHLGYADYPEKPGDAWFPPVWSQGAATVTQWPNYEIMSVSPFCTLAWVPYKAGDALPCGAVEGGYMIGECPTYIVSVYRADAGLRGALKFGEYAAGHSVAYYYFNGVQTATEFDILVRIWRVFWSQCSVPSDK